MYTNASARKAKKNAFLSSVASRSFTSLHLKANPFRKSIEFIDNFIFSFRLLSPPMLQHELVDLFLLR